MFIRAGDLDVHVQIDGPPGAPPVLLLHSLGTDLHLWDAQAGALSRGFRVIRMDLRGHGLSTVTPGPYSLHLLAHDVLAVLDALGIASAHIGGISIGGMVAQQLAAIAPARARSLMLCDTAMSIPTAESWHTRAATVRATGTASIADAVIARWVTAGFVADPAAKGLRAMLLRTDPEGYAAGCEAIASADLSPSTACIRVPTLVLVGAEDVSTPVATAEGLRDAIHGASMIVVGGAHLPTVEVPHEINAAMLGFLQPDLSERFAAGLAVRRQVLGDAHVDRALTNATDFDRPFQEFITRTAWGEIWVRPGLDRRTRSLITLAILAALGHHEEFQLHTRASRNTGCSDSDLVELLIQVACYAGVPAANSAMRIARETLKTLPPA